MAVPPDELLRRARSGEREALTRLLEECAPAVRRAIGGELPRRWRAHLSLDDVMQEAYTDAILSIRQCAAADLESFRAWLLTLARHNLVDAVRMLEAEKRGGGRKAVATGGDSSSFVALYKALGGTTPTASQNVAHQEAEAALQQAIERLPEDYRQVVQMYDLDSRPVEEVAAALKRSPGGVFMLRARAHRCLAEILGTASKYLSGGA